MIKLNWNWVTISTKLIHWINKNGEIRASVGHVLVQDQVRLSLADVCVECRGDNQQVAPHLSSASPPTLRPRGSPSGPIPRTGSDPAASCRRLSVSCGFGSWWRPEGNASGCRHPAPADHLANERTKRLYLFIQTVTHYDNKYSQSLSTNILF